MKPIPGGWNIVFVGAWNPAIINPNWLGKWVFKRERVQWDVLVPVMGGQRVMRFAEDDVQVVLEDQRLQVAPLNLTRKAMDAAQQTATAILGLLDHTPIGACGINYGWAFSERPESLAWVSSLADNDGLAALLSVGETLVHRRLEGIQEFGRPHLNLKLWDRADGSFQIDLNYHYDVDSTSAGAERIAGAFSGLLDHAEKVLAVYGLALERPEEGNT